MNDAENMSRDSSVVEHRFGKAEAESSILSHGTTELQALFWSKVAVPRGDKQRCWQWRASVDRHGYGQFKRAAYTNPVRAHRFAYELAHGPIADGMQILHSCHNPRCVNPRHLRQG